MDQPYQQIVFVLKLAVAAAFGAGCVAGWRWIARSWRLLGIVVGIGIIVRAWAGLGLFLISYYNLPILSALHTGDGFWHLAPDARVYFQLASTAATGASVPNGSPSPSFLEVLGLWLRATGPVPVSAVLFNVALYVGSCVLVVSAFRPLTDGSARRAALITVSALTFSPVLILLSTQPLKDVFSVSLIILSGVALASVLRTVLLPAVRWSTLLPVGCVALAIYLMAGVRAYYALFIWAAVAVAVTVAILTCGRALMVRRASFAAGVLAVLWAAFMWGAGPYYAFYGDLVTRTVGVRLPIISPSADEVAALPPSEGEGLDAARDSVRALRRGFVNTGGATNLASGSTWPAGDSIMALLVGVAALFIPVSVLIKLSVVDFSGGRGFLLVTDLDTLFVDIALLSVAWALVTSGRPTRRQWPFMCFALGLGLTSALLMAYVVTNYGTLFRLRLLAAVPLWLVPLALGIRSVAGSQAFVDADGGVRTTAAARVSPVVALRRGRA